MSVPRPFADRIIRDALHDPQNLRDLLETVLGETASRFDYGGVEYEDCEFFLPDMQRREADLLCRIEYRSEERGDVEMCVCVLIEHQSIEDHSMPLRMLEYAVLRWRRFWDDGPRDREATIPGIIPIVLFTGDRPWPTHRDLSDLIESPDALPWAVPRWPIRYLSLAEHSPEELLASTKAWHKALAVVRCEREKSLAAFCRVVGFAARQIDKLADTDEHRHWRLLQFILRWLAARRSKDEHATLFRTVLSHVRPQHREQIRTMSSKIRLTFEEELEQKAQERYEVGMAKGMAKGMAEGELNDCRSLLLRLLEKRFGPVPDALRQRICAADDIEHLRSCCEQVLDIDSLAELTL